MIAVPLGFGGQIVEALFLARPNRFLVEAELGGAVVQAHLADRGRLKETLVPGVRLLLAHRPGAGRKTQYQAVAAILPEPPGGRGPSTGRAERLAGLDTHLPTRLVLAALRAGAVPRLAGYTAIRPEATVGASRFDFLLEGEAGRCVLEVKSAGLVQGGVALFPDAPTSRGRRHVEELAALARAGTRAAVLFIAQGEAREVRMNTAIDPAFAEELARSATSGVEVFAHACPLGRAGIVWGPEVAVG